MLLFTVLNKQLLNNAVYIIKQVKNYSFQQILFQRFYYFCQLEKFSVLITKSLIQND